MNTKPKCRYCDQSPAEGKRLIRGVCEPCYGVLISTVREGTYTDAQLVAAGLLLPKPDSNRSGRPSTRVAMRDLRSGELDRRVREGKGNRRRRKQGANA